MRRLLPLLTLAAGMYLPAFASSPWRPFATPEDSLAAVQAVRSYLVLGDTVVVDSVTMRGMATEELTMRVLKNNGIPLRFPTTLPWRVTGAKMIAGGDPAAAVFVATDAEAVPRFGPLSIDWVYFVVKEGDRWKLATFERQHLIESAVQQLTTLDTSTFYPPSLKPVIVREMAPLLWNNARLREHLATNRGKFDALIAFLRSEPKLRRLGREDRKAQQINTVGISWAGAAQVVPPEAVKEFMASAPAEDRERMRLLLEHHEELRKIGDDSVRSIARRLGLPLKSIEKGIGMMHDLNINLINRDLPFKETIQFTVAGEHNFALGYLYAPKGEVPAISPEEYFYLEELGDGWWIYRSN